MRARIRSISSFSLAVSRMKTFSKPFLILAVLISAQVFLSSLQAKRGPQDNWYLEREAAFPLMPFLKEPHGFAIAPNGDVYAPNWGPANVSVWTVDGSFKTAWGSGGSGNGKLDGPSSCYVYGNEVFVSEYHNHRVQVFDLNGTYLRKWGAYGTGEGQFNKARDVYVNMEGVQTPEVYVADQGNHRIQVFELNGTFLRQFGSYGNNLGQLNNPLGVCVGPDGKVYASSHHGQKVQVFEQNGSSVREIAIGMYAADLAFSGDKLVVAGGAHHRVKIFETNGSLLTTLGSGAASKEEGLFNNSFGIAVDAAGRIHVSCRDNHRIQVFDVNGTYLNSYGLYGSKGVDITDLLHTPENTFIVADPGGERIIEVDENASLIRYLATYGSGDGQVDDPHFLAWGPDGKIYVSDRDNHRVQVLERNGAFVRAFGSNGSGDGQFNQPHGIVVSETGEVFVADRYNHRIQVFDSNGTFLRKFGSYGSLEGQLNQPSGLDLDDDGSVVVVSFKANRAVFFDQQGLFLRQWGIGSHEYTVDNLNNGLLGFGKAWASTVLRENDGTWLRELNSGGHGYASGSVSLPDGTIVHPNRSSDKLAFFRPTYRTFRPKQAKAMPFPEVISVVQRPGTGYLDVAFRINDADSPHVKAAMLAFVDGGDDLSKVIVPKTFVGPIEGKLDDNVTTGQTHSVTWNAGADWNVGFGELEVAILAQDDRGLFNLHFLDLGGADGNSTALKISRSPITPADLRKAWYWLIASGHPEVEFSGSVVRAPQTPAPQGIAPSDVPGLKLWLDAADVDANGQPDNLANDSNVTLWMDKAGGDHNATGGNSPTYQAAGLNGKPAVRFEGSDWLGFREIEDVRTVFLVAGKDPGPRNNPTMLGHSSSYHFHGDNSKIWSGYASASVRSGITRLRGTPVDGRKTNLPSSTFILSVVTTGTVFVDRIARDRLVNKPWNGVFSEILIYNEALSDENRIKVGKYLSEKWDLGYDENAYAMDSMTTAAGRAFLLDMANLRQVSETEANRAKEGNTPGTINQFTPTFRIGPGERPSKVNEFGLDTGAESGFWVAPK